MARDVTQLMPAHEYLHRLVKEFPRLEPLVEFLGEPLAGALFEAFAGDLIYMPSKTTLGKICRDEYIYRALQGKRSDGREYEQEVIRLSSLFGLPERAIRHMYQHLKKNGK